MSTIEATSTSTSTYQIAATNEFWRQLHSLDPAIFNKWRRVSLRFFKDPFHGTLRSHAIHHRQGGMYSAELDDNYRII